MQLGRLTVGDPTTAIGLELDIIAAVVIGGGSLAGGRGSILGSLIGAFLMSVLANGCTLTGVPNYVREILTGAIIVAAGRGRPASPAQEADAPSGSHPRHGTGPIVPPAAKPGGVGDTRVHAPDVEVGDAAGDEGGSIAGVVRGTRIDGTALIVAPTPEVAAIDERTRMIDAGADLDSGGRDVRNELQRPLPSAGQTVAEGAEIAVAPAVCGPPCDRAAVLPAPTTPRSPQP